MEPPIYFVIGPTGAGKSGIALSLAKQQEGGTKRRRWPVVLNCDVMQMFERGVLDTATNKMSIREMEGVPHMFMNFLSPATGAPGEAEDYLSAMLERAAADVSWSCCPRGHSNPKEWSTLFALWARLSGALLLSKGEQYRSTFFVQDATLIINFLTAVGEAWSGRRPSDEVGNALRASQGQLCCEECKRANDFRFVVIVCGGTHYYAQSLLGTEMCVDDTAKGSKRERDDPPLPNDPQELWERLREVDPGSAATFHPNDERRVRRRLESIADGSALVKDVVVPEFRFSNRQMCIVWVDFDDLAALKAKHDSRLDVMMSQGLVDEARAFRTRFGEWGGSGRAPSIFGAIGYQELAPFDFEPAGRASSLQAMKDHTHSYATQQRRWIRNRMVPRFVPLCSQPLGNNKSVRRGFFWRVAMDRVMAQPQPQTATAALISRIVSEVDSEGEVVSAPLPLGRGCLEEVTFTAEEQAVCQTRVPFHCDVCNKLVVGGDAIVAAHLASKGHRGAVNHEKLAKEQLEKFGRVIPPRRANH